MTVLVFLVPQTRSPLYVRRKVYMAPFHVRSKVCIAPFYVRSKVCIFARHLDGSIADFDPHMEGSHSDFAPHMLGRHSFRDQKIAKICNFVFFCKLFFDITYISGVYITYMTTIKNTNLLRESTFNAITVKTRKLNY